MNLLRRFSISVQLIIVSALVVGIFAAFSMGYFYTMYKARAIESLTNKSRSIAGIMAVNMTAGVLFEDADAIDKSLQGMKQDPTIAAAYVLDAKGKLLASYRDESKGPASMTSDQAVEMLGTASVVVDESGRFILVQDEIDAAGETIGRLVILAGTESIMASLTSTFRVTAFAYGGIFAGSMILLVVLTRSLLRPIRQAAATANRIARGELDVEALGEEGRDEISDLSRAINVMVKSLAHMLEQLKQSNEFIRETISDIQTSIVQQRHGLENQASAISEISTTINQLKTTSKQSASVAQRVLDDSERSVEVSKEGLASNQKAVGGMNLINEQMENIAETILSLSQKSRQIVDIVASVNDLAQQSNYLALNASIEAAKAGEHGKGFAVVAMEVRNLAEQSRQATGQIENILNEIHATMNSAVLVTESGTRKVGEGVSLIDGTGDVIGQLADVVSQGASSARQISASSSQQSIGVDQIAQAISAISQTMNETTQSAKQLEKAAEGLAEVGELVNKTIGNYAGNHARA